MFAGSKADGIITSTTHIYNHACFLVWVWNLVAQIEGRMQAEGFRE
jgi:hypothetical protein